MEYSTRNRECRADGWVYNQAMHTKLSSASFSDSELFARVPLVRHDACEIRVFKDLNKT